MRLNKVSPQLVNRHKAYVQAMKSEERAGSPGDEHLAVAVIFEGPVAKLEEVGFLTHSVYGQVAFGDIKVSNLERLADLPAVKQVEAETRARPLLDVSVPEINVPAVWSGTPSYKGKGVVVGIVDTGIDVLHKCFQSPDGSKTRILWLWDQTLPSSDGTPPAGFTYGQEFKPDAINDAIAHPDKPFVHQDVEGHGTHVAGIAAGDGSQSGNCHLSDHYIGVAPEADLIIVKSEFTGRTYVDGVQYIFDKAAGAAAVANLSLGTVGGPHDGSTPSEIALDALLTGTTGRAVVVAAGNSGSVNAQSSDAALHAHKTVAASDHTTMTFKVLANDRFRLFADIRYGGTGPSANPGPAAAARLKLTLKAPDGTTVDVSPGNDPPQGSFAGGTIDLYSQIDVGRVGRHKISFELWPLSQAPLTTGDWIITLEETAGVQTDVDCWLYPYNSFEATEPVAAKATVKIQFNAPDKVAGLSSSTITYTGAARLSLVVTTPDPDSTTAVDAGAGSVSVKAGKHTVRVSSLLDTPSAGEHKIQFWIDAEVGKTVDKGLWTVTLTETAGQATIAQCSFPEERPWAYVADGVLSGHTERNQPKFIVADRDSSRTLEAPATAQNVIAVGSYDPRDGTLADSSSKGPTIDSRHKPDIAAPGVAITAPKTRARGKMLVSDCCLDFYVPLQGTSMAAPHVTGVVALMLQRNPTLDFAAIRKALMDSARAVPGGDPDQWGKGKVNAQTALTGIAAAGSGGGGGGGGGGISFDPLLAPESQGVRVPLAAVWPRYLPTTSRMNELHSVLAASPTGQLFMALVSRHFDEISRIVNRVKRVAVIWQRMHGPLLVHSVLGWEGDDSPPVPSVVGDYPVAMGLERLFSALERHASPILLNDLHHYRNFVLALPGARLSDIEFSGA